MTKEEIEQIEINIDWLLKQLDFYEGKGIQEKVDSVSERIYHELSKLDKNEIQLHSESVVQ